MMYAVFTEQLRLWEPILAALMRSCWTLLLGYLPALFLGLILGVVVAQNRILCAIAIRLFQLPASIPIFLVLPVGLSVWKLDRDNLTALTLVSVTLISTGFIAIYTAIGMRKALQRDHQWHLAVPHIFVGIRFGLTIAWSVLIVIESVLAVSQETMGIGYYIWDAYNAGNEDSFAQVISGAIAVTIVAFGADQFLDVCSILLKRALRPSSPPRQQNSSKSF